MEELYGRVLGVGYFVEQFGIGVGTPTAAPAALENYSVLPVEENLLFLVSVIQWIYITLEN